MNKIKDCMKELILCILISTVSLVSCITARCPGFDMGDFRYISFRKGDSLMYVSNKSDTISLVVNQFFTRGPYSFCSPPDYECDLDTYYQTDTDTTYGLFLYEAINYEVGEGLTPKNMNYKFGDDVEYKGSYTETFFKMEVSDTIVNNVTYLKYVMTDRSQEKRISSFVKVDSLGIVEFRDKSTGLIWKLKR